MPDVLYFISRKAVKTCHNSCLQFIMNKVSGGVREGKERQKRTEKNECKITLLSLLYKDVDKSDEVGVKLMASH